MQNSTTLKNSDHLIGNKVVRLLVVTFLFGLHMVYSQSNNPSPFVQVTDVNDNEDILVDCDYPVDADRCFELVADFTTINETVSYDVVGIDYSDPVVSLTEDQIVSVADDDTWSEVLGLPFTFCFYNDNYDAFVLGDNGVITFDTAVATLESQYIRSQLPNGQLVQNAIFGVFHDMVNVNRNGCTDDPATPENECGEIKLYTVGTEPQRSFIISYEGMNHFDCEDVKSTSQIVLYETSNIIEVYVQDKPINCEVINAGDNPDVITGIQSRKNALIGIQNEDSSQGIAPPARNNSEWSTTNEAWRFTPNGSPLTDIVWTNEAGVLVGVEETLEVCPEVSTTYTATVSYDTCVGGIEELSDTITITIDSEYPVANDLDELICDLPNFGEEEVNLTEFEAALVGAQTGLVVSYHENLNQARDNTTAIPNPDTYVLNSSSRTIYARLQRGVSCFDVGTILLRLTPVGIPEITEIAVCDEDNNNEELIDLTDYDSSIIGSQADMNITYYFSLADAESNANPQTELNAIPTSSVFVKLTIGDEELCENITEVPVRLITKPIVEDIPIELCDHIRTYDLTQHEDDVNANNTIPLTYSYYITNARALNNSNEIPEEDLDQYVHDLRRTIYVRAQGPEQCFDIFQLNFTYLDGIPVTADQQIQLDSVFDLTTSIANMIEDDTDITVEYIDCDTELPIPDPENYDLTGFEGEVCVVFTNDIGCINKGTISLTSTGGGGGGGGGGFPSCDSGNDGSETFTLSDFRPDILANITFPNPDFITDNPDLIVITFHESETEAIGNNNAITTKTIFATETIYMRISVVFDEVELDAWTEAFILDFKPSTAFNEVTDGICDAGGDERETVDLTAYEEEILDGGTGDFTYFDEADEEIEAPTTYTFIGPSKEIKVIVETADGCENETKITLTFDDAIPVDNTSLPGCDEENDGIVFINLNDALPKINEDHTNFTATFYISQTNANNEDDPFPDPTIYELDRASRRIYVRLEDTDGCYNTTFVDLTRVSTPTFRNTNVEICDAANDNIERGIDLSNFDSTISSTLANVSVSYYRTEQEAMDEADAIEDEIDLTPNLQLYANLVTTIGDCIITSPITFTFFPTPEVADQTLIVCDNENDSSEIYDLTQHEEDFITDTANTNTTYHRSLDEAERGINRITTTTVYPITVAPQIVYARVVNSDTGCYSIANLNIEFTQPVEVTDVSLSTCDIAADGSEIFDVTSRLSDMIDDPNVYDITYYSRRDAALEGDVTSTFYVSDPTNVDTAVADRIYVRFYEEERGCYAVGEVSLVLLKTPKLVLGDFEICDTDFDGQYTLSLPEINEEVISNTEGLNFSYFNSFENADENLNSIENPDDYLVVSSPEVVFVRVEGDNGCFSVSSVTIVIDERVVVNEVSEALEVCDDDMDLYAVFNLTSYEDRFTDEIGATFKYYNSREDVNNETNEILDPTAYTNSVEDEERIFVRVFVEDKCDDFTSFMIETIRISPDLSDVSFCDGDTATLDGGEGYVSYLWSTGATTRTIEITDEGEYTVTLENDRGCEQNFPILATKLPLPQVTNYALDACDDDGIKDGFTSFNLTEAIAEITQSASNVSTVFYRNQNNFDEDIDPILPGNFINTSNPQTLLAKVTNTETECFDSAELILRVNVIQATDTSIVVCDEVNSEDGINMFTLSDADEGVANGSSYTSIAYFASEPDATNAENPLAVEFQNTTAYNQTIYARIEKTENELNCFDISAVSLIVNELPPIEATEEVEYCQNFFPERITLDSGIETAAIADYSYVWSTGAVSSSIAVNEAGEYTVVVTNNSTDCSKTKTITVNSTLVETVSLPVIEKCDEDEVIDGSTPFVLSALNNELTNSDPDLSVSYFLSVEDADNSMNSLNSNSFVNTQNPQTIYAKVLNDAVACYAIAPITLQVNFIIPNSALLETCDLLETDPGIATFDLSLADSQVTNGLSVSAVSYFENLADAEAAQNELNSDYTNVVPFSQEIYSRIISEDGCVGIGEVLLIINDLPDIPSEETRFYCIDTFPSTISLSSDVSNPSAYTYSWNTGATTATLDVNEVGIYTVEVTSAFGCTKEKTIEVTPSEKPTIDSVEIEDQSTINTVTVFASGLGLENYEYALDGGFFQESNFFDNVTAGFHTVYVSDENCGVTEMQISIFGIPQFFTPNGDGTNDYWKLDGASAEFQNDLNVFVYDRFGKLLKQLSGSNIDQGWDGSFGGKQLPSTDYWYKINYQEVFSGKHREIKGHFSLIR